MHGLHLDAHGPLNMGTDQVVKKWNDYNYQEVIDAWHQVCGRGEWKIRRHVCSIVTIVSTSYYMFSVMYTFLMQYAC